MHNAQLNSGSLRITNYALQLGGELMHEIGVRETINLCGFNDENVSKYFAQDDVAGNGHCDFGRVPRHKEFESRPARLAKFRRDDNPLAPRPNRRNDGQARKNACAFNRRAVHVPVGKQFNRTRAAYGIADKRLEHDAGACAYGCRDCPRARLIFQRRALYRALFPTHAGLRNHQHD